MHTAHTAFAAQVTADMARNGEDALMVLPIFTTEEISDQRCVAVVRGTGDDDHEARVAVPANGWHTIYKGSCSEAMSAALEYVGSLDIIASTATPAIDYSIGS